MKLSDNGTAVPPPSHVDLDDVTAALKTGMVSAHEARIATALLLGDDLIGLRALEEASGICRKSILKVLPYKATGRTTLLERTEKGEFAWEAEDRVPMTVEYRSFVHHKTSISSNPPTPLGQGAPGGPEGTDRSEEISGAPMTGVLDPSKDLWANGTENGLGDHGWVLAMVTKLRETTFTVEELKGLLRLGERQLRRVLDKMGSYVRRVKEGRRSVVTVDFSLLATDPEVLADHGMTQDSLLLTTDRRDRKAAQHMREYEAVEELGTQDGRRIREMWANRHEEAEQIRRLLEGVPEGLRHRTKRILSVLDTPSDRRDKNWMSRWVGESRLRRILRGD